MAIRPIQMNTKSAHTSFKQKEAVKPYLEAEGAIKTDNLVKPLPPKGHLVSDNIFTGIKYFFKDIGYDMKALKYGLQGKANDHQLGRLNDVGLRVGGIGIATYLASKTPDPKIRLMEYIGLGTFLTSMSIYPKIAINTPTKIIHGFDVDKEFIDDQGRKKSVLQDANYVPYEMYITGDKKYNKKDLDKIGDDMGISRNIHNRHDLIKEQMRKIGTQNNTLWMLTAGFATPMMTALICNSIERGILPIIEKNRNNQYNAKITDLLAKTKSMEKTLLPSQVQSNKLSIYVEKALSKYKGKQLPEKEIESLIEEIAKGIDENASETIRTDLRNLFESSSGLGTKSVFIDAEVVDLMQRAAKDQISKKQKPMLEPILVPSKPEIEAAIKKIVPDFDMNKGSITKSDNIVEIKEELRKIIRGKIAKNETLPKIALEAKANVILDNIMGTVKESKSTLLTEDIIKKAVDFSKIIGEFKANQKALDLCKNFKVEEAQETILARYYEKFEKTLFKELNIEFKNLKQMRDTSSFTQDILDKRLEELAKDETRFTEVMKKMGKVVSEMEIALNGEDAEKSFMKDLINAYENNFNYTAKRLHKLGFAEDTVDRLVKQDVDTLATTITNRSELFDYLDGIIPNKYKDLFKNGKDFNDLPLEQKRAYIEYNSNGVGSSKRLRISRMVERYQGVRNTFNRFMHTLDVYKRALNPATFAKNLEGKSPEYVKEIIELCKKTVLSATTPEHVLKLNQVNNPDVYRDVMLALYSPESGPINSTKEKAFLTKATKQALGEKQNLSNGNILERLQCYLTRFRNIIANNDIEFMKPEHKINPSVLEEYTKSAQTERAIFDLIGKDPVEMFKEYAGKQYGDKMWLRRVGVITGVVFGATILIQHAFGKIRNPQNVKEQVKDEINK